jgi:hypothetical protein
MTDSSLFQSLEYLRRGCTLRVIEKNKFWSEILIRLVKKQVSINGTDYLLKNPYNESSFAFTAV